MPDQTKKETDPLSCTFEEADRQRLLDGMRMSVEQRVAWFEEATRLAHAVRTRKTKPGCSER